jgi:hypothetical protein
VVVTCANSVFSTYVYQVRVSALPCAALCCTVLRCAVLLWLHRCQTCWLFGCESSPPSAWLPPPLRSLRACISSVLVFVPCVCTRVSCVAPAGGRSARAEHQQARQHHPDPLGGNSNLCLQRRRDLPGERRRCALTLSYLILSYLILSYLILSYLTCQRMMMI